ASDSPTGRGRRTRLTKVKNPLAPSRNPPIHCRFFGASVAQLARASDYGSEGSRFKSWRMRHYSFLKEPGAPREMGPFWLAFPLQTRCLRISGDPFLAMKTPFCGKVWPSFRVAADGLAGSERGPSGAEAAADLPPFRGQPRPVRGLESGPPAPVPLGKVLRAAWDPACENPSPFLVVQH